VQHTFLDFQEPNLKDLRGIPREQFDALPFGVIQLDRDGTVKTYNRWESELARRKVETVIGKNFFRDVAPCTDVAAFRGRLDALPPGSSYVFDFEFDFPWGRRAVRVRFHIESADERWVFVTDVT